MLAAHPVCRSITMATAGASSSAFILTETASEYRSAAPLQRARTSACTAAYTSSIATQSLKRRST